MGNVKDRDEKAKSFFIAIVLFSRGWSKNVSFLTTSAERMLLGERKVIGFIPESLRILD